MVKYYCAYFHVNLTEHKSIVPFRAFLLKRSQCSTQTYFRVFRDCVIKNFAVAYYISYNTFQTLCLLNTYVKCVQFIAVNALNTILKLRFIPVRVEMMLHAMWRVGWYSKVPVHNYYFDSPKTHQTAAKWTWMRSTIKYVLPIHSGKYL